MSFPNGYQQNNQFWVDPNAQQYNNAISNSFDDLYPQMELNHQKLDQLNHQLNNTQYDTYNDATMNTMNNNVFANHKPPVSDSSSPKLYLDMHRSQDSSPTSVEDAKTTSTKKVSKSRKQLDEQDAILIAKDDSELSEEELQLKRKAQNRQAQRAFRERKESKLQELQKKLNQLELERQQLLDQLACIREQNLTIATENQILKLNNHDLDTSLNYSMNRGISHRSSDGYDLNSRMHDHEFNFPVNEDAFIEGLIKGTPHTVKNYDIRKVYDSPESGLKLLGIGAVWDYLIIKSDEYDIDSETVDVNLIMSKLRGHELCHGFGPAYPMELVDDVFLEIVHRPVSSS